MRTAPRVPVNDLWSTAEPWLETRERRMRNMLWRLLGARSLPKSTDLSTPLRGELSQVQTAADARSCRIRVNADYTEVKCQPCRGSSCTRDRNQCRRATQGGQTIQAMKSARKPSPFLRRGHLTYYLSGRHAVRICLHPDIDYGIIGHHA